MIYPNRYCQWDGVKSVDNVTVSINSATRGCDKIYGQTESKEI